jgi:hypothetical protein
MVKSKGTKRQTMDDKTLHRNLKPAGEVKYSGNVNNSCFTIGTPCATVKQPVYHLIWKTCWISVCVCKLKWQIKHEHPTNQIGDDLNIVLRRNHSWYHNRELKTWKHVNEQNVQHKAKFFQWLAADWWSSPGIPVSSTNKTDYIIEILLKVALNINNPNPINAMYVNKLVTDHL